MRLIKRIESLFQTAQIVLAALLVAACLLGLPFGIKPYIVLSGSMEPYIQTGSLAYVDRGEIPRENFIQGDVIAFKAGDSTIVSHRVVENDTGRGAITTKGDANAEADPVPVVYKNVVGETILSIPYLGYVLKFIKDHWLLVAAAIALLNVCAHLLTRIASDKEALETEEKESGQEWSKEQKNQNA